MPRPTIYHNPRCSKSRATLALLEEHGADPLIVDYLKAPPSAVELQAILKKLRQLQAFIDQRCAAFNAKPKHAHLAAFFKPVQDQIARALRK